MSNKDGLEVSKLRSSFSRAVGVLVGGTAFAHAITALALPVLTRLYSPADFSALAVFAGLLSIISVAACLRFDVAVSIPEADSDAINVLALALVCAALVAGLLALLVVIAPMSLMAALKQPALVPYFWLLPLGVLLAANSSALQNWFIRKKEFGLIARSRIGQSAVGTGTQLGLGFAGLASLGLLTGYVMNIGAACIVLGYRLLRGERSMLSSITRQNMRAMFVAYGQFPKYSTIEALSNSAAIQVPIILIAGLAIGPEAGYLMLAISVMQAPMALIGNAIGQVYLSRAPDEHRAGRLGSFTVDVLAGLMKTGVGPIVFAGIVSPAAFGIVFGPDWHRAGELVAWMTPWFALQFLASPVSMALLITNRHQVALALQVFSMVIRVAAVYGVSIYKPVYIAEAYALSGAAVYFVYLFIVLRAVDVQPSVVVKHALKLWKGGVVWVLAGVFFVVSINSLGRLF